MEIAHFSARAERARFARIGTTAACSLVTRAVGQVWACKALALFSESVGQG